MERCVCPLHTYNLQPAGVLRPPVGMQPPLLAGEAKKITTHFE
jgi:hypothetical protein